MGSRYLVTGVQLGVIKGLIKAKQYDDAMKDIDELIKEQCIGESKNSITDDCEKIKPHFEYDMDFSEPPLIKKILDKVLNIWKQ